MEQIQPFDLNLKINEQDVAIHYLFDRTKFSPEIIYSFLVNGQMYEPDVMHFLTRVLGMGDVFVDIGAHIGFFTLIASKLVGPEGRVVAFEPDEANRETLAQHIELNEAKNIEVRDKVLCAEPGPVTFYVNLDNDGGHALWDVGHHPKNEKSAATPTPMTVEAMTVDAALADFGDTDVKVIKIDTEGGEHEIMKGALDTLEKARVPFFVCELNDFGLAEMGSSERDFRDFMTGRGYDTFALDHGGAFPKLLPNAIKFASRSGQVVNALFSRADWLAPYWRTEEVP